MIKQFFNKNILTKILFLCGAIIFSFSSLIYAVQAYDNDNLYKIIQLSLTASQEGENNYIPGSGYNIYAAIEYDDKINAIGVIVDLPENWTFREIWGEDAPYNIKQTGTKVELAWVNIPESPINFNYLLNVDKNSTGIKEISAKVLYRRDNDELFENFNKLEVMQSQDGDISLTHSGNSYISGGTATINCNVSYTAKMTALGLIIQIPQNWSLNWVDKNVDEYKETNDGMIELFWTTMPESPIDFSYSLNVPDNESGIKEIKAEVLYRISDGEEQRDNMLPNPLPLRPAEKYVIIHASAGEGGEIIPSGEVKVVYGEDQVFERKADDGYKFEQWIINGEVEENSPFNQYRFYKVTSEQSIVATFTRLEYTVTAVSNEGGNIIPSGKLAFKHGESQEFKAEAFPGYVVDKWIINGQTVQQGLDTFLLENIESNVSVSLVYRLVEHHIYASAGEGGIISPDGDVVVKNGTHKTFIITPNQGYRIYKLIIDDVEYDYNQNTYTFTDIEKDHSINALFVKLYYLQAKAGFGGEIDPKGNFNVTEGTDVTFEIKTNDNYTIDKLFINDKEESLDVLVDNKYLIFENVQENKNVRVEFALLYKVLATSKKGGSISPIDEIFVKQGDNITFTIYPDEGYAVDKVLVNGNLWVVTDNTLTIENVNRDFDIEVNFIEQFKIIASSEVNGKILPEGEIIVNKDSSKSFEIKPDVDYEIKEVTVDGITVNLDDLVGGSNYIFNNINSNHEISVSFKPAEDQKHIITATAGVGGKIEPSGEINVNRGASQEFKLIPDDGYAIDQIIVNGNNIDSVKNSYTLNNVIKDSTINVTFIKAYKITVISNEGGNIEPSGDIIVKEHSSQVFTVTPDEDYAIEKIIVDGHVYSDEIISFEGIISNHDIKVVFTKKKYSITSSSSAGGKISPIGMNLVSYGDDIEFTITPVTGFRVKEVLINGKEVQIVNNKYTFTNITNNATIHVNFEKLTYIITSTYGSNGSIDPSGEIEVSYGTLFSRFRIKPNTGYIIDSVIVDGIKIDTTPDIYTFWMIDDNHKITASFKEVAKYHITSSVYGGVGGTINPVGDVIVKGGEDQIFYIKTEAGYELIDVIINNVSIGPVEKYIFLNIGSNHSIQTKFEAVEAPVADFEVNESSGTAPLIVKFENMSKGKYSELIWDFGDNSIKSTQKSPKHIYEKAGNYTAKLTVSGPGGKDTKSMLIEVNEQIPLYVNFRANKIVGTSSPMNVGFTALVKGNVSEYLWDFGDGSTSTEIDPSHIYNSSGNFTVSLTVSGESGSKKIVKTDYIKIISRSISGIVTNENNVALEGYSVEVWYKNEMLGYAVTNEDGKYSVTDLSPAASLVVAAFPPYDNTQYFQQFYSGSDSWEKADRISIITGSQENIDFKLVKAPNFGIKGTVFDDSNNGVSNVMVNVYSEKIGFGLTTMTDTNGNYAITGLIESGDYIVSVWSDEHSVDFYYAGQEYSVMIWEQASKVEVTDPPVENIDIFLDNTKGYKGVIKGKVFADGQPLEGIWVNAWSKTLNTGNGILTDKDGSYIITGLREVTENINEDGYLVDIFSIRYPYQAYNKVQDITKATLVATGSENIDFILSTKSKIMGVITDKSGQPVPNTDVKVWSKSRKFENSSTSDEYGNYTVSDLPPAIDYYVAAVSMYYPIQYYNKTDNEKKAVKVDLTQGDVYGIDFELDEGYIIAGYIYLDDTDHPGSEGIWVNVWSESTNTGGNVSTDSTGRFEITGLDETASDYIISVWRYEDYMPSFYNQDVENKTVHMWKEAKGVMPSSSIDPIYRNILLKKSVSIKGKIIFNNMPVPNIRVDAVGLDGAFGTTLSYGFFKGGYNYEINGIPPGTYEVSISSRIYMEQIQDNIVVDESGRENIDFILQNPEGSISGKITGIEPGKIFRISAWSLSLNSGKIIKETSKSEELVYNISGIKRSNDYLVEIRSDSYPYQVYNGKTKYKDADMVDISNIDAIDIDFNLISDTATISGIVTFPEGAAKGEKAYIDAFSMSTGSGGGTYVVYLNNLETVYKITGLKKANDYRVSARSDIYEDQYFDGVESKEEAELIDTSNNSDITGINFVLSKGQDISGTIYDENGNGIKGIKVEAWSASKSSFGIDITDKNGEYKIEGLKKASDFIVEAIKSMKISSYIYNTEGTVRNQQYATFINTDDDMADDQIDLILSDGYAISGKVKNEDSMPLANISIKAETKVGRTSNTVSTADDGSFVINGLPFARDYILSAIPTSQSIYIESTKENIISGSSGNDFVLQKGYILSGIVKNIIGEPLSNIEVLIDTVAGDTSKSIKTNSNGEYEIKGLPTADDYFVRATPSSDLPYAVYEETNFFIDQNINMNIILEGASEIRGKIYMSDGVTGVEGVLVTAEAKIDDSIIWERAYSDIEGYYTITNIPNISNYIVTARPENYPEVQMRDKQPGSGIDFTLETGGYINGFVKKSNGEIMADVKVEIVSVSANIAKIAITDNNGFYQFKGLKALDRKGNQISDYMVSVRANNFPEIVKGSNQVNKTVDFTLISGDQNEINGILRDINGEKPGTDVKLKLKVYKEKTNGGFVKFVNVDSDGNFIITGLNTDQKYQLKIKVSNTSLNENGKWVWAKEKDGAEYDTIDLDNDRNNAKSYDSGNAVEIRFSGSWTN